MADLELLDRGYAAVMARIVETGTAHHFTELAAELGIELETARQLVHELVAITPGWVHPGTDLLASFPPFNLQPTQYRVSIDGKPGWYAQCGFEATAIRWLVPGKTVRIDLVGSHTHPLWCAIYTRVKSTEVPVGATRAAISSTPIVIP